MKSEYYFHVADPAVIANRDGDMVLLRFQTVEASEGKPRRSGKYIHLELTNAFAMSLLEHLKGAKMTLGLPGALPTEITFVPPEKDRN